MNELTQKKIRMGDVLTALDMKRTTLRNWFDRNEIELLSGRGDTKWTEFTLGDVAVLALMQRLVRWGLDVERANLVAAEVIAREAQLLLQYRNTPVEAFTALMTGKTLAVFFKDGDYTRAVFSRREDLALFQQLWAAAEAENTEVDEYQQEVLLIDLRSVLLTTFNKLDVHSGS